MDRWVLALLDPPYRLGKVGEMMKRFFRPLKTLACKMPGLGLLVEKLDIGWRYKIERALIKQTHRTANAHPSILHFTANKAASQHVVHVLSLCGRSLGLTPAKFHEYAFHSSFPTLARLSPEEIKRYYYLFKPTGYVYTAFNGMIEGIPDLERYKTVLMLRDPRDALVSSYYSYAYSHALPPRSSPRHANFVKTRQRLQAMTLDEYVRGRCLAECQLYERYHVLLMKKYPSSVYFTKYEEMTADYARWLRGLLDHTELNVSKTLFDRLVQENERARPMSEDINKHRRRGRPGEYREKLSQETIAYMNDCMQGVLEAFGYKGD
jgi:hypothetical protein